MRKMFKLATWTFMAVMATTMATTMAKAVESGTPENWTLSLQFKLDGVADLAPVIVGVGNSTDRLLRPPSLPGTDVTGDSKDVWLRAYVPDPVSKVAAFKSVATATTPAKNVWALRIAVPAASRQVSVDIGTNNFVKAYYPITIVDPVGGTVTEVRSAQSVDLFTSNGSERTLYFVAGASKAFVAASGSDMVGLSYTPGLGRMANADIKLFTSGCSDTGKTAKTDANGIYTITGLAASTTYTVKVDKPDYLGGECTITTDADAQATSEATCVSLYAGDVNDDHKINVADLFKLQPYYNKSKTILGDTVWTTNNLGRYDLNADEQISIKDLMIIKNGYNTRETFACGS